MSAGSRSEFVSLDDYSGLSGAREGCVLLGGERFRVDLNESHSTAGAPSVYQVILTRCDTGLGEDITDSNQIAILQRVFRVR